MRRFRSRLGLLVLVVAGLSACSAPVGTNQASPAPRGSAPASAAPADSQRCARLVRRGFTPCPPTANRLQLPPTTIRNATNGAVPDATAQQWGRAFQLAQAYYYWAMQHDARSALTSGVLADASPNAVGNLFGTDLQDLDAAAAARGTLVYQPPHVPLVQIVAVPSSLKAAIQRQGLTTKDYGIALRLTGPTSRVIRLPDGTDRPIAAGDATFVADLVTWGEVRDDPDLGRIWFEYGYYGCEGDVRPVCQL